MIDEVLASLPRGSTGRGWLDTGATPDGQPVVIPVLIAKGAESGQRLVVLGGVHGDEYEGPSAIATLIGALDPATLRGEIVAVPVANPPAFALSQRASPLDGLNLARTFPGLPAGSVTQRIAHVLTEEVLAKADFLIDLHSSGTHIEMPLLVGYRVGATAASRTSREAALRFGAPVVWGHASVAPGRSLSGPDSRGVPWLYTESPGGGWLNPHTAAVYRQGVVNVLRYLGMLPGDAPRCTPTHELCGDGDVDTSLAAPVAGWLWHEIALLDSVERGQLLGTIRDTRGEVTCRVCAPAAGRVVLRRATPSVAAGDLLYLVT